MLPIMRCAGAGRKLWTGWNPGRGQPDNVTPHKKSRPWGRLLLSSELRLLGGDIQRIEALNAKP